MKRPLLNISILFVVAVYFFLLIFPPETAVADPGGSKISFTGKIYQKEYKLNSRGQISQILYLQSVEDKELKVQCYLDTTEDILAKKISSIGSYVEVEGTYWPFSNATNPGEFDSLEYYRILKISYRIQKAHITASGGKADLYRESLWKLRCRLEKVLDNCLEYRDAAIMKAVLLGDKAFMDDETNELYKKSGIIHILAVSGLHISIIGMGIYKLLRKLGVHKSAAFVISVFIMWSYGVMCGMSPSAYRAIVMFAINIFSHMLNRTYDMMTAMAVPGVLLALDNPLYLHHSGFLMSFGAVCALGYVLPALQSDVVTVFDHVYIIEKNAVVTWTVRLMRIVIRSLTGSVAILLVTLPVYMDYYYSVPIYASALNIIVLPLMPVLMIAGILCILLGLIWEVAGLLPGFVIHLILKFYECSCKGTGRLPGGTAYVGHAELWQVVIYLLLIAAYVILHDVHITQRLFALHNKMIKMKYRNCKETELFVIRSALIIAGLIIIFYRPSYGLKISLLDVGQGDGIVIESGREAYLIDGGSTSKKEVGKYQLKPFLAYEGIGHLNAVILTHEDEDHMSGMMELMEDTVNDGIRIDNLILPDISDKAKKENYRKLEQAAALYHIPVSYISREDTIKTGNKDLSITCLGPVRDMYTDEPNAYSTILYVKYRSFTALLTGDVEGQGQENLTEYIKESSLGQEELTEYNREGSLGQEGLTEYNRESSLGQEELTEYNRESCLGQDWSLTAASRASDAEISDIHSLPAQVTLLKVAHHGSRYTTDQEFLDLVDPQIAIISCGKNNTYGHPHQEVLDRLDSIGSKIYRTDQQGCITITIDRSDSNRVTCKTFITQNTK